MEEQKDLNFVVSVDEANVILGSLGELPAKVSMNLIQKLQQQAAPQLVVPKKDDVPPTE